MVIVMANGHARRAGPAGPNLGGKGFGSPDMSTAMEDTTSAIEDDMTQVLIPSIGSTYRTLKHRDHRTRGRLSRGGMQTLHVTFYHLELFSSAGGFSGALNLFAGG